VGLFQQSTLCFSIPSPLLIPPLQFPNPPNSYFLIPSPTYNSQTSTYNVQQHPTPPLFIFFTVKAAWTQKNKQQCTNDKLQRSQCDTHGIKQKARVLPLSSSEIGRKLQEKVSLLNCERILKFELGMGPFLSGVLIRFPHSKPDFPIYIWCWFTVEKRGKRAIFFNFFFRNSLLRQRKKLR